MTNSAEPDQFFRSQLIWIYPVCKDMVYPGSAEQGFSKVANPYKYRRMNSLQTKFEQVHINNPCLKQTCISNT